LVDHDRLDGETDDALIGRVAATLRGERGVSPALDARVMAMIRAEAEQGAVAGAIALADEAPDDDVLAPRARVLRPPSRTHVQPARRRGLRGAWEWAARPRTVRVSPLAGLALAAGLSAVMVLGARATNGGTAAVPGIPTPGAPVATTTAGPIVQTVSDAGVAARLVTFVLVAPDARNVSVAGDFNDWAANRLQLQRGSDGVWTATVPLAPGRYSYSFVVDGDRWVADPAMPAAPDDFGTPSSILTVGGR
jgi:hypothetical protein